MQDVMTGGAVYANKNVLLLINSRYGELTSTIWGTPVLQKIRCFG
ncbi:hypothetical protein X953_11665 [Virgibacillus sp. SK37]|nr:hypothetical protein X953_11665 [Virgibacillus sp. SK37]